MELQISHSRQEEEPEAKARWFQSLPLEERMDLLCFFTDLALENNASLAEREDAQPTSKRIRILTKA